MYAVKILLLISIAGPLTFAEHLWAAESAEGQLFAQKKVVKKKLKSEDADDFSESAVTTSIHEGGSFLRKGPPYIGEVGVLSGGGFSSTTTKETPESGEGSSLSGTTFTLSGQYLFILWGRWGIGPILGYNSTSGESENKSNTTGSSSKSKFTSTITKFGIASKIYIGNLSKDQWLPYGRLAYTLDSSSLEEDESGGGLKVSGSTMMLAGGLNFFLAPHIALGGDVAYVLDDSKNSVTSKVRSFTTKNTEARFEVNFGVSMFL